MRTTIKLHPDTRDKLSNLGKKHETYDQIILRLIEKAQKYDELMAQEPAKKTVKKR